MNHDEFHLPRVYELLRAPHAWSHWGDFGDVLVHGLVTSRAYSELPLRLERTGPYVPPMMQPGPVDVVVTDPVRERLQELVRELRFREVVKARIARVDWHTWNPEGLEPRFVPESNEPADYVLAAPHDAELAESLGPLWEILPDLDMEIEDDDGRLCPENYYGQPFVRGRLCGGRNYVSEEFRAALEEVVPGHAEFRPARAVRRIRAFRP